MVILVLSSTVPVVADDSRVLRGSVQKIYRGEEPATIGKIHNHLLEVTCEDLTVYIHLDRLERTLMGDTLGPDVPPEDRTLDFRVQKDSRGRWILESWTLPKPR